MDDAIKKALVNYLEQQITPHKRARIDEIIAHRTRHITVLLEDIFQQHNASAVVRSVECFGIQDLHIVQDRFNFSVNTGRGYGIFQMDLHASVWQYPRCIQSIER